MAIHIRRREFIFTLGGAAAAWPLAARAQGERMRRIGVLSTLPGDDPEMVARRAVFEPGTAGLRLDRGPQPADRLPLDPVLPIRYPAAGPGWQGTECGSIN